SPPSGNVQGQDQDNILTPPAPQDTTSTSSPPPVDTNTSPFVPDSGTSLQDSQHSPSNSADKGKSVEITPFKPECVASSNASTAAIQSSPFAFMLWLRQILLKDFVTTLKLIAKFATQLIKNSPPFPLMEVKLPPKDQFHEHDPSAKKADEQLYTLVVTDIPFLSQMHN
ncbi:hypothetical protein RhiirA4_473715, partial [Rhizophagus irregularis]